MYITNNNHPVVDDWKFERGTGITGKYVMCYYKGELAITLYHNGDMLLSDSYGKTQSLGNLAQTAQSNRYVSPVAPWYVAMAKQSS